MVDVPASAWPYLTLVAIAIGVFGPIFLFDLYLRRAQAHWTGVERRRIDGEAARNIALLQTSLDAIIISDENGIIIEWNPAAERIFRCRRGDAIGKNLTKLIIPPAYQAQHEAGMARYRKTGIESGHILGRRLRVPCQRVDGDVFEAELVVNRVPLAYETPPLFVGFIRDIMDAEVGAGAVEHPSLNRIGAGQVSKPY